MKIAAQLGLVAVTMALAGAADRSLAVYVVNGDVVPFQVRLRAQTTAGKILAGAGIPVGWRAGEPKPGSSSLSIVIQFATDTPASTMPGALAFAQPYGEPRITVFFDRITVAASPGHLLAHVIAHEIGHVLQGVSLHAESGVMKATWSGSDQDGMRHQPLEFTAADIRLIHLGYDMRVSRQLSCDSACPSNGRKRRGGN